MSTAADILYEGRDLEAMSFARNYHAWIRDEFRPFIGRDVAEVGAGTGDFSELLLETPLERLTAIEPSDNLIPLLRAKLKGDERAGVVHGYTSDVKVLRPEPAFDAAVYVNVMEHVEDDEGELRLVHAMLKEGGHVCIFVPALPWLYSEFDRTIGHYRRYEKAALVGLLEKTGFEPVKARYFDIAGILPWYIALVLLKKKLAGGQVSVYDKWVVPFMRRAERTVTPPIGKNLLVVGRKR